MFFCFQAGQVGADPNIYDGRVLPSGYEIALACGPLKRPRYINPAIEKELAEFKEEIADKFEKSHINKTYEFPRRKIFAAASESPGKRGAAGAGHSREASAQAAFHSNDLVLAASSADNEMMMLAGDEGEGDDDDRSDNNYEGGLPRHQSKGKPIYKQSKGTIKQLMQINISSEQQLKSMLTDKGADFEDADDDEVQMGEVPILAHLTPSGPEQLVRENDYDQPGRTSSQAPIKPQKKQKIVQGGRGSSRNAIRDS